MVNRRVWEVNSALKAADQYAGDTRITGMIDLLNRWEDLLPVLRRAAGLMEKSLPDEALELEQVAVLAPVPNPGKMMNVGLNFYDHAEEMGMEIPSDFQPNFFWKGDRNCIIGPSGKIRLSSEYVDWEAELAVVIGKTAKDVSPATAITSGSTAGASMGPVPCSRPE